MNRTKLMRELRLDAVRQEFREAYNACLAAGNGVGKLTPARERLKRARRALKRFKGEW